MGAIEKKLKAAWHQEQRRSTQERIEKITKMSVEVED